MTFIACYVNKNGSKVSAELSCDNSIKNYLVMIDDDGGENQKTDFIEFRNMEKYGRIGIYAMNLEEADKELKKELTKMVKQT